MFYSTEGAILPTSREEKTLRYQDQYRMHLWRRYTYLPKKKILVKE